MIKTMSLKNYTQIQIYHMYTGYYNDNGLAHRLDGPAIVYNNGNEYYYINGTSYYIIDYKNHPDVLKFKQIREAKRMLGLEK